MKIFLGGEPLELAYKIKTIVFDKTGTITQGVPSVTKFCRLVIEEELPLVDLLYIIGSAESNSEHSLATAVVKFTKKILKTEKFYKCSGFQAVPGCGLKSKVFYQSANSISSINFDSPEFVNLTRYNKSESRR